MATYKWLVSAEGNVHSNSGNAHAPWVCGSGGGFSEGGSHGRHNAHCCTSWHSTAQLRKKGMVDTTLLHTKLFRAVLTHSAMPSVANTRRAALCCAVLCTAGRHVLVMFLQRVLRQPTRQSCQQLRAASFEQLVLTHTPDGRRAAAAAAAGGQEGSAWRPSYVLMRCR